ncbi:MAG: HAD family phosphatase [Candidatus Acidiferrum sp.]
MPGATAITAIIFDIGRVLIRVDLQRALEDLSDDLPLSPAEVWSAIENDPRWPDWQEGRISAPDWYFHLTKRLGASLTFEQFTAAWNRSLDPQPIHELSFFENLSKRYKLGLLSNTDAIHVAKLESTYDFFHYFPPDVRTYSCTVGASKPDPLIYREALRSCKVHADQALYIDDIPEYVEAAKRLGMSGIRFRSADQLYADMRSLGVSPD